MTDLDRLPRTNSTWELLQLPHIHAPGDLGPAGMLLVVEADTGLIRLHPFLDALEQVPDAIFEAATDPSPATAPGLPRAISCPPELATLVRPAAELVGAAVTVTTRLPAAEEARDSFLAYAQAGGARLPQTDLPWGELMAQALDAAPWQALPDSVIFAFESKDRDLHGSVLIVLGRAGAQRGFSWFPSFDSWQFFQLVARAGTAALKQLPVEVCCAHFSDTAEASPHVLPVLEHAGLVHGGYFLELYAIKTGELHDLAPAEEHTVFRAIQAALAAWEAQGPSLATREWTLELELAGGVDAKLHVLPPVAHLPPPDGILDERPHLFGVFPDGLWDEGPPTLLFKFAKADAVRCAKALSGIDRLDLRRQGEFLTLHGRRSGASVGLVATLEDTPAVRGILTGGRVRLSVAAGGARRQSVTVRDVLLELDVEVVDETWDLEDD